MRWWAVVHMIGLIELKLTCIFLTIYSQSQRVFVALLEASEKCWKLSIIVACLPIEGEEDGARISLAIWIVCVAEVVEVLAQDHLEPLELLLSVHMRVAI